MRRILIAAVAALAVTATAFAATQTVTIPALFKHQLAALHHKGIGPILLPQTMPLIERTKHLYPTVDTSGHGYELDIGAAPGCRGANACFVAEFSAQRARSPFGNVRVALVNGKTGWFKPLTCGGSCSPPSIEWRGSGFVYEIQANVGTEKTEQGILVAMANSAIVNGAR
jgi:hypothetical protein